MLDAELISTYFYYVPLNYTPWVESPLFNILSKRKSIAATILKYFICEKAEVFRHVRG